MKGNMVRPSTWHPPSTLVTGPDPILGSFDARRASSDVQGFKEQNTGNDSTDINVREHTPQMTTSSTLLEISAAPITDQLTAVPLESSAPV